MLTPNDIKIEKIEYQNGEIEYHVKCRKFERVKTGLFSSEMRPSDIFEIYQEVDGYIMRPDGKGICTSAEAAIDIKEYILRDYYISLPTKVTEI